MRMPASSMDSSAGQLKAELGCGTSLKGNRPLSSPVSPHVSLSLCVSVCLSICLPVCLSASRLPGGELLSSTVPSGVMFLPCYKQAVFLRHFLTEAGTIQHIGCDDYQEV